MFLSFTTQDKWRREFVSDMSICFTWLIRQSLRCTWPHSLSPSVFRFSVSCTKRVSLLRASRLGHRPAGRRGRPPSQVIRASREHFLRQVSLYNSSGANGWIPAGSRETGCTWREWGEPCQLGKIFSKYYHFKQTLFASGLICFCRISVTTLNLNHYFEIM